MKTKRSKACFLASSKINFFKSILFPVLGFGLAGLIWGIEIYFGRDPGSSGDSPFVWFMGIFYLGIIGSASLVVLKKDWKQILRVVGIGIVGFGIGFIVPRFLEYWVWFFGNIITLVTAIVAEVLRVAEWRIEELIQLEPSLLIGDFWLQFLIIGIVMGFLYALMLKVRKWPMIWRGGVGFALASLISPVIGNLIGGLFNSLLLIYVITFFLIGGIFGLFLAWGMRKTMSS